VRDEKKEKIIVSYNVLEESGGSACFFICSNTVPDMKCKLIFVGDREKHVDF